MGEFDFDLTLSELSLALSKSLNSQSLSQWLD